MDARTTPVQIPYAELRCRTHYSFLRGASHPRELVERAAELGLAALAITDRNGVYGMPKAYEAIKELKERGAAKPPKLIVGAELTLESLPHLTLIATDRAAYGLMCRLLTASHKTKDLCALGWQEFTTLLQRPGSTGLIAIPEVPEHFDASIDLGFYELLSDLFKDRLYLPVSKFLDGRDHLRGQRLSQIGRRLRIPLVATNDVHYHHPDRRILQDILTCTRELTTLADAGYRLYSNSERYLKSPEQMARLFQHDLPEALHHTLDIASRCTFCPSELRYRYPSEWIPPGETAQSYLEKLTWQGARSRYPDAVPIDVIRQIKHELALIEELKFADYFLTIWEIVEFARSRKILCQGRGSAANSVVCYCLGITAIDPVRGSLLFERFISAERNEPPDIDVDFEHERREEVIQHIYEKYGRDRAGMVSAVITYREKSAIRDISKALGVAPSEPFLEPLVDELYGFPRHLSIHSGGFTLSADPIIETVPIEPARMEGRTIVQWDKEDLAAIGLLKVDVLALGMLSALRKTFDLVRPKKDLTVATIPPDDAATYAMIQKADTVGVFQIESRAQMNMLCRLKPRNFYDLVVEVALVRPGPIVGKMVHPYLRRRKGEPFSYEHPKLEKILGRTLGVPLFQEQVMKMAIELAGFSPGEADRLRRAINAWKSAGSISEIGLKLKAGLLAHGLSADYVERIFQQIQGFAHYGFPESHAASFALLAYASSYLKCHYPAEFTCSLLNSLPMGFYSAHTLVEDVKRHGVEVLPVHPNLSDWDCAIEEGGRLRIGLRVVSGLGESDGRRIVEERRGRGPYRSLDDFLARVKLPARVLYAMAMGDAFASFGEGASQRDALWRIFADQAYRLRPKPGSEQLALDFQVPEARAQFAALGLREAIEADYLNLGLSTRGHPMQAIRELASDRLPPQTTREVKRLRNGARARLAGLIITRQRPSTSKGTVFATLEDEFGFGDLMLKPEVYERYRDIFRNNPFVVVSGKIQTDGDAINLIVDRVEGLDERIEEVNQAIRVRSHDFH